MSKSVISFTAQVVKFETSVPFSTVISRLDEEVNREGSNDFLSKIKDVKSQAELEGLVRSVVKTDFVYFMEMSYKFLKFVDDKEREIPRAIVYTIGNPLIAQSILKHNTMPVYNIPPRLLIIEKLDGSGSIVIYHLPSSIMSMLEQDPVLQAAVEYLDDKLENLAKTITAV